MLRIGRDEHRLAWEEKEWLAVERISFNARTPRRREKQNRWEQGVLARWRTGKGPRRRLDREDLKRVFAQKPLRTLRSEATHSR